MALAEALRDWTLYARPKQLPPPGDWFLWLVRAGRGFGKTRTGGEFVRSRIDSGEWGVVNIAGPTKGDVIDIMVNGTDAAPGLMKLWPEHLAPTLNKDEKRITCHNGAMIRYMSADEPERFRGPQADGGWCDEIDSWKPKGMKSADAWALFEMGIRLGPDPRIIATGTPKRGRLMKELGARDDAVVTTGSTHENRENLAEKFFRGVVSKYQGTHMGRQEIGGEILADVEGAMVTAEMIDDLRVQKIPDLVRVVVGVDPSGSTTGDMQGIVAAGKGVDAHGYVLADRSCSLKPGGWGRRSVETALEFDADCIAVETNYGGDMAEDVILKAAEAMGVRVRVKRVNATRAKHVRFEPVAFMYEKGNLHHVGDQGELEAEVCGFTEAGYEGDESPNRADGQVWALADLFPVRKGLSPDAIYGEAESEQEGAAA